MMSWQCQGPACGLKAVLTELPSPLIRLLLWSRVAGPGTHSALQRAFLALRLSIFTRSFPPLGCLKHISASPWDMGQRARKHKRQTYFFGTLGSEVSSKWAIYSPVSFILTSNWPVTQFGLTYL